MATAQLLWHFDRKNANSSTIIRLLQHATCVNSFELAAGKCREMAKGAMYRIDSPCIVTSETHAIEQRMLAHKPLVAHSSRVAIVISCTMGPRQSCPIALVRQIATLAHQLAFM